jgi:hypothetical protein
VSEGGPGQCRPGPLRSGHTRERSGHGRQEGKIISITRVSRSTSNSQLLTQQQTTQLHCRVRWKEERLQQTIPDLLQLLHHFCWSSIQIISNLLLFRQWHASILLAKISIHRIFHRLEVRPIGEMVSLDKAGVLLSHVHLQVLIEIHIFLPTERKEGVDPTSDCADNYCLLSSGNQGAFIH